MTATVVLVAGLVWSGCVDRHTTRNAASAPPPILAVGTIPDVSLNTGETASVTVPIKVAEGYHVQANPAGGEFLVPTELQFTDVDGVAIGPAEYPEAIPYRLENTDDVLQTYEGAFSVRVPVTALKTGALEVRGSVKYQACDAKRCLFPTSVPFTFRINVPEKSAKGDRP